SHGRQMILPPGHMQIVLSLGPPHLTDCSAGLHAPARQQSFAVLVGMYSRYQVIDTADLAHLIGIVFRPGGTTPFLAERTDLFTNLETSLEDIWGSRASSLRDQLAEASTPHAKFDALEAALLERLRQGRPAAPHRLVHHAISVLDSAPSTTTITELSRSIGLSSRRLSQLFAQHVGVSPKLYARIRRFQQAVALLHRGGDVPWAELALNCGYYDQSHFANDFRAFSSISPTTYTAASRPWSNHIALDASDIA
ncbi:MAG TPA: AraC family transcriptional regulator, partial [Edaphobacter sp.]